jgi:hypothetical protein
MMGAFMQLQNNLGRRRLILLGSLFLLVIFILLAFMLHHRSNSKIPTGEYQDPFSHETVSNPAGKGPDVYGAPAGNPVYLGFDKLLDHGMAFDQLQNLKSAFYKYDQANNLSIKEISIDVDHITTEHPDSQFFIFFKVMFNRKDVFKAKVDYTDVSSVRLYLMDSTGKLIFDSQVVNS